MEIYRKLNFENQILTMAAQPCSPMQLVPLFYIIAVQSGILHDLALLQIVE